MNASKLLEQIDSEISTMEADLAVRRMIRGYFLTMTNNGHNGNGHTNGNGKAHTSQKATGTDASMSAGKRKRSNMSAAARKAVSKRMKAYWANRKKAGKLTAKGGKKNAQAQAQA